MGAGSAGRPRPPPAKAGLEVPGLLDLGKRRRVRAFETFRSLDGSRLGELRRAGQEIDEPHLEATFLDDRVSVEDARQMGHIPVDELIAQPELLAARDLVLHHFSARYTAAEVAQICQQRLPDGVKARARALGTD
jgi:hypothetical protein